MAASTALPRSEDLEPGLRRERLAGGDHAVARDDPLRVANERPVAGRPGRQPAERA
jgi:hypothetical protein